MVRRAWFQDAWFQDAWFELFATYTRRPAQRQGVYGECGVVWAISACAVVFNFQAVTRSVLSSWRTRDTCESAFGMEIIEYDSARALGGGVSEPLGQNTRGS